MTEKPHIYLTESALFFFVTLFTVFSIHAQSASHDTPSRTILKAERMRYPAFREQVVKRLREREDKERNAAIAEAKMRNLPIRVEHKGGHIHELARFRNGRALYRTTLNANAAISTGADILQSTLYNLTGSGMTIGIWDAGAVMGTHQELTGRVTSYDDVADNWHSTHIGGTIGASGVNPAAKGMAPAVNIDSYDWVNDISEMTGRGASYAGEPGKLQISNHSYGYYTGWVYTFGTNPKWIWYGEGTDANARELSFGVYSENSYNIDELAYSLPYYLTFWAGGNDGVENPKSGDYVKLSPTNSTIIYNPALHPPGDAVYRDGYDTMSFETIAKNVVSVGSVEDAVSNGARDLNKALISSFSSYGPTDDGRIKPDLVANGHYLTSARSASTTAYGESWGTSVSVANASGTALQLLQWYEMLNPGSTLRASSLKALLLHTADDLGATGPDYKFGWGLINAVAAAEHIQLQADYPESRRISEDTLTTAKKLLRYWVNSDRASPIKATLCWTDPPGAATSVPDSRTSRLVNNLDLRIISPDGTVHEPWVMPFTQHWTTESCAYPATTGSNSTDNVEQVVISAPRTNGVYEVRVTYSGTLADSIQDFSLMISGVSSIGTVLSIQ